MIALTGQDPRSVYTVMVDPDDANQYEFKPATLDYVMTHAAQWDAVSFSRQHYYDLWALRAWPPVARPHQYDLMEATQLAQHIKEEGVSFYPVASAFNGLAIYKHHLTEGCRYYGRNMTGPPEEEEDCEHVGFHRCMIERNGARVRVHNESLFAV